MDLENFRAQLEAEFEWRSGEVRWLHNLCEGMDSDEQKRQFRRAIVLLLYSHFEGYCKFSLQLYVSAVNGEGLSCREANPAIAAASLNDIFAKLRDGTGKAEVFRNSLPDDSKLHRFAREREFVERTADMLSTPVSIPDQIVNTESNLKPAVLRKNLFMLGLPFDQFKALEPDIDKLLALRNGIAHGSTRGGVDAALYESLKQCAFSVMSGITSGVTRAFDEKWFLANAPGQAQAVPA